MSASRSRGSDRQYTAARCKEIDGKTSTFKRSRDAISPHRKSSSPSRHPAAKMGRSSNALDKDRGSLSNSCTYIVLHTDYYILL